MRKIVNKHVVKAIELIGGYDKTAAKLKLHRSNLSMWVRGVQRVPIKHAVRLQKFTKGEVKWILIVSS